MESGSELTASSFPPNHVLLSMIEPANSDDEVLSEDEEDEEAVSQIDDGTDASRHGTEDPLDRIMASGIDEPPTPVTPVKPARAARCDPSFDEVRGSCSPI